MNWLANQRILQSFCPKNAVTNVLSQDLAPIQTCVIYHQRVLFPFKGGPMTKGAKQLEGTELGNQAMYWVSGH